MHCRNLNSRRIPDGRDYRNQLDQRFSNLVAQQNNLFNLISAFNFNSAFSKHIFDYFFYFKYSHLPLSFYHHCQIYWWEYLYFWGFVFILYPIGDKCLSHVFIFSNHLLTDLLSSHIFVSMKPLRLYYSEITEIQIHKVEKSLECYSIYCS